MKIALAAALLILVAGCGSGEDAAKNTTPKLQAAYETCNSKDGEFNYPTKTITVADEGRSLIFDNTKDPGDIACLLNELKTSQALVSELDATTAMMGRQNSTEGGLNYAWSYHPDNGFNMTITETQAN